MSARCAGAHTYAVTQNACCCCCLHNMASPAHISIAGATGTATHGSGDANGNLFSVGGVLVQHRAHGVLNVRVGEATLTLAREPAPLGIGCVVTVTLTIQPPSMSGRMSRKRAVVAY